MKTTGSDVSWIHSFPPIADDNARLVILGSIPGQASLRAGQYYAHPRNQFWPLMAELLAFDAGCDYQQRCGQLRMAGIALWDVLQSCVRPGSLDAAIDDKTAQANDFQAFFSRFHRLDRVFFNGATAERLFIKQVLPLLPVQRLSLQRLPSTSPAHAGMSYKQKLQCWQAIRYW